jgi:excisionase family DNA binding protein
MASSTVIGRLADPDHYLTTAEAAAALGCSDQTIRDRINRGTLPAIRTRYGALIERAAVLADIERRRASLGAHREPAAA